VYCLYTALKRHSKNKQKKAFMGFIKEHDELRINNKYGSVNALKQWPN
jgi:hypothetical protein